MKREASMHPMIQVTHSATRVPVSQIAYIHADSGIRMPSAWAFAAEYDVDVVYSPRHDRHK
jgi:hypothetical protein